MNSWDACRGPAGWLEMRDDLQGEMCFGGMDLASTMDITAVVLWFPDSLSVLPFFWIPEEGMRQRVQRDRVPYDRWAGEGAVFVTPGEVIDQGMIEEFILNELAPKYQIQSIGFDPWNATQLASRLTAAGAQMIQLGQTISMMAEAVKRIESVTVSKTLRHGAHPVLRWMASNAATKSDPYGNRKIVKPEHGDAKKVDGMVALAMAVAREIKQELQDDCVYEERGIITV